MAETQFVNGLIVKRNPKAPSFVICNLSFKVQEFIQFLKDNDKAGWVNAQILLAKDGSKLYAKIDNYSPNAQKGPKVESKTKNDNSIEYSTGDTTMSKNGQNDGGIVEYPTEDINPEDIPF